MYELVLTMLLMYPGSATTVEKTILARYETVSQCESAKRMIDLRYNTSLQCIKMSKKKI